MKYDVKYIKKKAKSFKGRFGTIFTKGTNNLKTDNYYLNLCLLGASKIVSFFFFDIRDKNSAEGLEVKLSIKSKKPMLKSTSKISAALIFLIYAQSFSWF